MRLATLAILAVLLAAPAIAQPLDLVAVDGPWWPATVRYARADGLVLASSGSVLGRSWDGGASWETFADTPEVYSIRAHQGSLLAASRQGLVRSTDNGATWAVIAFDGQRINNLQSPDSLYVQAADGTVYRSGGDPGRWAALAIPANGDVSTYAAGPGGEVAARSCAIDFTCQLHRSTDFGETFWSVTAVTPPGLFFEQGVLYGTRSEYYIQITFPTTILVPGGVFRYDGTQGEFDQIRPASIVTSVRRQPDGRLTYAESGTLRMLVTGAVVPLPAVPQNVADAVITDAATLISLAGVDGQPGSPDGGQYVETDSGMMVLRDGALRHTGFATSSAGAVTQLPEGNLLIGTVDAYRFDGAWQPLGTGAPPRQFVPMWGQPDTLIVVPEIGEYAGYQNYPNPILVDGIVEEAQSDFCDETLSAISFTSDLALVSCSGYLDFNFLATRDRTGNYLTQTGIEDRVVSTLITAEGLWAGAAAGSFGSAAEIPVRFSDDGGQTWQDRSAGLNDAPVVAMASLGDDVFAGTPTGIARWDGAAWLTEQAADGVATFAEHDGVLYAGADGAVFRRDVGEWTEIGSGLDGARVRGLAVGSDADGFWMVAATDQGVRTTRPSLLVGSDDAPLTAERRALRAFPNPVRGSLTIETPSGAAAGTQIEIYDAVGRRVGRVPAGRDGVARWDTRGVPPGVYLLRTTGDDAQIARVVVVR